MMVVHAPFGKCRDHKLTTESHRALCAQRCASWERSCTKQAASASSSSRAAAQRQPHHEWTRAEAACVACDRNNGTKSERRRAHSHVVGQASRARQLHRKASTTTTTTTRQRTTCVCFCYDGVVRGVTLPVSGDVAAPPSNMLSK